MSYVPGFRYDLFISYATADNADAWVEKFQAQLIGELVRLLGRPFSEKTVYLDKLRLQVAQSYPDELDKAARESALLVALLSPNYVSSDWCNRERQVFQTALPPGAAFPECLVSVRLRPTGPLPENLRNAQREDFVIPGFQEPWPAGAGKWIEIVNRLAAGIKDALQNLRRRAGAVFVGPTLSTAMELRANLVDYLSEQHFRATPDPIALLEDRKACQAALTESACAVHFIGGATEDALQSIEDSINSCPGPTIVFQPFGAKLSAAEEQVLADLPPDRHLHRINANEIELRKFLEELLTTYRQAAVPAVPASLGLVCDLTDLSWAQAFRAAGLSVEYPRFLFDKNLGNLERLRHWKQLVQSHGLLFYHGQSAETLLDRIRRLAHEEKSQAIQRWYLDQPDVDKKRPTHPDDPVYPEDLEPFLDQVRRRAEGK